MSVDGANQPNTKWPYCQNPVANPSPKQRKDVLMKYLEVLVINIFYLKYAVG
jgi:hypothetical protein